MRLINIQEVPCEDVLDQSKQLEKSHTFSRLNNERLNGEFMTRLRILVVAGDRHACRELGTMVNRVARGAEITLATYNINVLKVLKSRDIDVVFLNITSSRSELQFARALSTISHAQAMIFISDHSRYAVDAFELNALDYLVKPVTFRRISESMHRLPASHTSTAGDQTLAVTHGSITQFIWRSDIVWAEAHGDHVFLHTHHERHTLRTPLASLADAWYAAGFMRIHRSYLVNIGKIEQIQTRSSRITVLMDDGAELNVSRRQARELPEYMVQSDLV